MSDKLLFDESIGLTVESLFVNMFPRREKKHEKITAEELMKKYNMERHVENGRFSERHYESNEDGRASSGAIYYYVEPGEKTVFHSIDCDEYWCFSAGETLELWLIDKSGTLSVKKLGITEDAEPLIYIEKGTVFACRSADGSSDGTFVSCITVPRFSYDGFRQYTKEEIMTICPEALTFRLGHDERTEG